MIDTSVGTFLLFPTPTRKFVKLLKLFLRK